MGLAFHKEPIPGESAPGYLLRLADKNGYFDLSELLLETQKLGSYRQYSHMDKLSELAKSLGSVGCDSLLEPKSVKINSIQAQSLTYKAVLNKFPRVCTACMAQGSPVKADWHVMQITHCEKHGQPLITTCTCGKPFVWDEALLSYGCSSCGKAWFEFEQQKEALPDFLQKMFELDIENRAEFINDITAAALARVRPYDSIIDIHHISPKHASNWVKLLSDGYSLLTKSAVYELWIASCADARKAFKVLGNRAVFYPFYRLCSQLKGDWLIKAKSPMICNTPPEAVRLISEMRSLNNKRNIMADVQNEIHLKDTAYIHHIDRDTMADMLEIDISLSRALFKLPVLESYTNHKLRRNNIACINDFLIAAKSIRLEAPIDAVPLSDLKQFVVGFGATLADVLIAVFEEHISSYMDLSKSHFLESVLIQKAELAAYLSGPFMREETRIFSMTQVTRVLGLPRNVVAQIALSGEIEEVPSPKNHHNYKATSIAQFLDSHLVIPIWAEMNNLCETKIIKTLLEKGHKASWGHALFKKTNELLELLASIRESSQYSNSKQLQLDALF
jgi:hypothetical protein